MSKIPIMLKSNGNWDNYGRFRDFEVDAIVVDDNANYGILSSTIAEQLSIDTSDKIIEIKYIVNENCPPMEIRNDMGVRAYMETKKENKNLGSYPLCISVRDFNMELAINNESTSAGSSGSLNLLEFPSSPAIEEYQSEIITESTPVVVVDGTFLKSAYRGIMLTVITMDAVGTIFPLAYAVVDSENDASWKWFFEQFKEAYGERPSMCVVSDRHESILKATSVVYPGLAHYSCMWHIWTNI
uniref:Protein FAR1-RELATED SEQUENCE 5-like n=1 Tax=Nicotiana sylvestris TaxID=4096 RepID=A0A1U7VFK9_NICSY